MALWVKGFIHLATVFSHILYIMILNDIGLILILYSLVVGTGPRTTTAK